MRNRLLSAIGTPVFYLAISAALLFSTNVMAQDAAAPYIAAGKWKPYEGMNEIVSGIAPRAHVIAYNMRTGRLVVRRSVSSTVARTPTPGSLTSSRWYSVTR